MEEAVPGLAANNKRRKESERRDDDIMATNNSSIVSKRSVERLYFPHEPHFFRYFVKKPQRRSPLINRGYWLRMKAIDHTVQQFLEEPSGKNKFVVNLGCGYDPLPFQCLARYRESCKNVKFVDIDYPLLMAKKCTTVVTTPELIGVLDNPTSGNRDGVMFQSDQYIQIGCDLREIPTLSKILEPLFNRKDSLVLFTAEVSITYMRLPYADRLIEWAATFPDARFCLLEQILPDGSSHPFAKTMLAHFNKLQTPLHSVELYPTIQSQEKRFKDRQWPKVKARSLWELWNSQDFLTAEQRISLDDIEPFDEWEEFALFGEHYFLLIASNDSTPRDSLLETESVLPSGDFVASCPEIKHTENPSGQGCRRFGATLLLDGPNYDPEVVANHAGMGLNTRMSSVDIYSSEIEDFRSPSRGPSPRQCHTITDMGDSAMLIGGRTSPDNALSDCWLYHKKNGCFNRLQDLPIPRFRHSAIALDDELILVLGGKSDSRNLVQDCLILYKSGGFGGWKKIPQSGIDGDTPQASYGATLICAYGRGLRGLLTGGILKDGTLSRDIWMWEIQFGHQGGSISIAFRRADKILPCGISSLARFGASVAVDGARVYIVGGIARSLLTSETEVVALNMAMSSTDPTYETYPLRADGDVPRPLLIGTSIASVNNGILIMGGGAICFSFGALWNEGCYTLMKKNPAPEDPRVCWYLKTLKPWKLLENAASDFKLPMENNASAFVSKRSPVSASFVSNVPRTSISNAQDFEQIMRADQPVILEGLDLGSCISLWTPEYLKQRIGHDRLVVVHESTTKSMDFQSKNFRYTTKPFGEFVDEAEKGGKLYLRALSEEKPSELPTNLARDFPSISEDFHLPPELQFVAENAHSSPLRISGDVALWLHYDVMANVLCQIRGTKRLRLYPPSDVQYFQFAPGASSSSIDVFCQVDSSSSGSAIDPRTHPYEAVLNPGDVLFLPSLWLHAAAPTTASSVAVNVFFRNLSNGYAAGKDVYGNRDLAAYEKGRLDVTKIAKSFEKLPVNIREFYLLRLAEELREKATAGM